MLEKIKRFFNRGDSFDDLKAGYSFDELFPETKHSFWCNSIVRAVEPSLEKAQKASDIERSLSDVGYVVSFLRDHLEENDMLPGHFFKKPDKRKKLMAALQHGVVFLRSVKEIED